MFETHQRTAGNNIYSYILVKTAILLAARNGIIILVQFYFRNFAKYVLHPGIVDDKRVLTNRIIVY